MKKTILITASVMLFMLANRSAAQSRLSPEQLKEIKAKFTDFKAKLNLSDDQAAKVKVIDSTYFEGLAELRTSNNSKLSRLRKFKSLNANRDKQMKQVLNAQQLAEYQAFKTEMKDEFKASRNN